MAADLESHVTWSGTPCKRQQSGEASERQGLGRKGTSGEPASHAAGLALCRLRGRVAVWRLSKGFGLATQEPWIQFATIRDNILFGKMFDAQLYKEVLEACALNDDLSVSAWPPTSPRP